MSEITNFPTYKQKENILTNYTLFLFQRLYNYDLNKFQLFINTLIESDTNLVPKLYFGQQESTESSVVDGVISQKSFKILIETKNKKYYRTDQINNHLTGFEKEDRKILLLIGGEILESNKLENIREKTVTEYNKNIDDDNIVELYNTSFNQIIKTFREVIEEFDVEMQNLVDDYEAFCEKKKVLNKKSVRMRVVPCGTTYDLNMKYDLYYMSAPRGYRSHKYIGLYKNKCIQAIGEIKKISQIEMEEGKEDIKVIEGDKLNKEEEEIIFKAIKEAYDRYGDKVNKDHRFFIVDKFYETEYKKTSKYGVQNARYYNLENILGEDITEVDGVSVIADKLKDYEF